MSNKPNCNILGIILANISGSISTTQIRNKNILEELLKLKYSKELLLITGYNNGMISFLHKDRNYITGSFYLSSPIVSGINVAEQYYVFGLANNTLINSVIKFPDSNIKKEVIQIDSGKLSTKILCKVNSQRFASVSLNDIFIWNISFELTNTITTDQEEILFLVMLNNELICSADNKIIKAWHLETRNNIFTFEFEDIIEGLKFIRENLILTIQPNGIVKIWKYENNTLISACEIKTDLNNISSTALYNDLIATAYDNICIYNLVTGGLHNKLNNNGLITAMVFINKNIIASAKWDKCIEVKDIINNAVIRSFNTHNSKISCLLFNQEYSALISCSSDSFIKYLDLRQECIAMTGHQRSINKIIKMNNNYIITCSTDKTIKYWNLATYKCMKTISQFENSVLDICKLNKNEFISYEINVNKITIWNFKDAIPVTQIVFDTTYPKILNVYQNKLLRITNHKFLTANNNGHLYIYNYQNLIKQLGGFQSTVSNFHSIDKQRIGLTGFNSVTIYNFIKEQVEHRIDTEKEILCLIKVGVNRIAYAGFRTDITIFNYETKKVEWVFDHKHHIGVSSLALLDKTKIVSSGIDGSIKVWLLNNFNSSTLFSYCPGMNSNILVL
jgi:WD40 repeat protein